MSELFELGFGIHNAGMLRPDRTLTERLFADGLIKARAHLCACPCVCVCVCVCVCACVCVCVRVCVLGARTQRHACVWLCG